jgi:hypothetical protein
VVVTGVDLGMTEGSSIILEYLEIALGAASEVVTSRDSIDLELAAFPDVPCATAMTFISLDFHLRRFPREDGNEERHELLFAAYRPFSVEQAGALIGSIARDVVDRGEAIGLGEVLELGSPIVPESTLNAVMFYTPVYYPAAVHVIDAVSPRIVPAWIIPVHDQEAAFIREWGTAAFNHLLGKYDPDLLDLERPPVPLPPRLG